MKLTSSICRISALAAVALSAASFNASAASVTMNLGTVIPGGGSFVSGDLSSSPYVVLDFTNVGQSVTLKISCPGLGFNGSGDYEHIGSSKPGKGTSFTNPATPIMPDKVADGLLLNVKDAQVGNLTFTYQSMTIQPTPLANGISLVGTSIGTFLVTQGLNAYGAVTGTQNFDINIPFAEDDIPFELGNGKSITYLITSSLAGGVSANDFVYKDVTSNTYYAAAMIDDADNGGKGSPGLFVGATGTTTTSVPDAGSSAALLALALLGIGGARRIFSKA